MVLLVYLEFISLKKLNTIFNSFPGKLRHKIEMIYCLTTPTSFRKVKYQSVYKKPIVFFPTEKLYINGLIKDLKNSEVLTHYLYLNPSTIEILKYVENHKIFVDIRDDGQADFIKNKAIFIQISNELDSNKSYKAKVKSSNKEKYSTNHTEIFLQELAKNIEGLELSDIPSEIKKYKQENSFKSLLSYFHSKAHLTNELQRVIKSRKIKNIRIIKLSDKLFWYDLLQFRKKQPVDANKNRILVNPVKPLSKKSYNAPNKNTSKKSKKLKVKDRLKKLRESILKQVVKSSKTNDLINSEKIITDDIYNNKKASGKTIVEFYHDVDNWKIFVDGKNAANINSNSIAVLMIKELAENYNSPKRSIPLEELDQILYKKLPQKKTASDNKKNTIKKKTSQSKFSRPPITDNSKNLRNRLSERIRSLKKLSPKLDCLEGHFRFPKSGGAYFDSMKKLKIIFVE